MTQSFDEWNKETDSLCPRRAYEAGAASRQDEIDELQKRIKKVLIEVNMYYDTDGMHELFFSDIANILKGKQND